MSTAERNQIDQMPDTPSFWQCQNKAHHTRRMRLVQEHKGKHQQSTYSVVIDRQVVPELVSRHVNCT
jgi:hypothetical protein